MAPKLLVEPDIEFGKRLLEDLDRRDVRIDAALWVYDPDSEKYRLVISSEDVDTRGARPIYAEIQKVMEAYPEDERRRFWDIAVTSPSTSVVAALSTAIHTSRTETRSIRITDRVVNRELIEDAYVYRMSLGTAPTDVEVQRGNT